MPIALNAYVSKAGRKGVVKKGGDVKDETLVQEVRSSRLYIKGPIRGRSKKEKRGKVS